MPPGSARAKGCTRRGSAAVRKCAYFRRAPGRRNSAMSAVLALDTRLGPPLNKAPAPAHGEVDAGDYTLLGLTDRKRAELSEVAQRLAQSARAASRTSSAWPRILTLRQTRAIRPCWSISTVVRSTPIYLRPNKLFSRQTP